MSSSRIRRARHAGVPAALVVAVAALSSCKAPGKSSGGSTGAATVAKTVGVTLLTREDEFYRQLEEGLRAAAAQHGYAIVLTSGDRDLAKQQSQIDNFIVQHVDAIVVCPVDTKGIGPAIEKANAANIPVFTADIAAQSGHVVAHVASDNVAGGRLAADYVAKAIGGAGDVGIIGENDVQTTIDRQQGFMDGIKAYPNLKLVAQLDGSGVRDRALKAADDMLQAHPSISAIFAINDESALGTLSAVESRHKTTIIVGYDAAPEAQRAILAGSPLRADVAQQPKLIGQKTIDAIATYFAGQPPKARIAVPVTIVDAGSLRAAGAGAGAAAAPPPPVRGRAPIAAGFERVQLAATSLVKRYPGVTALDGVSITICGGEVHAVAGENGAGKSTLMHVLAGAVHPDDGRLTVDDKPVRFDSPRDAQAAGIRMIHQELNLVPDLTVAENVFLGDERARAGVVDGAAQARDARAVLDRLGQRHLSAAAIVRDLPLAARQMTEIAKAVAAQARVLIMDEPTAILAHEEVDALFAVIAQLRATGVAIVYVSHRLDEIFQIADHVTVLRDGALVDSGPIADVARGELVRLMVGRELAAGYPARAAPPGNEVLRVEHLSAGPVTDASFALARGEIVGVVGLVGSGRTDLVRAIYGAARVTNGRMRLDGEPYAPRHPRDAIAAGVALLPEDRKRQGLVLTAAIRENVALASLDMLSSHRVVNRTRERAAVTRWCNALHIKMTSIEQPVRQLSGGTQQKVVLARWMLANARILLFDEPTRGIDVGAKAEIYHLMRRLADDGAAIVMISSDLPEALGMADRLLVMRAGRIVGTLARDEATQDRVAALILGEASTPA